MNFADARICDDPTSDTRDILFPHQDQDAEQIAVDIGGSLAKIVYFVRPQRRSSLSSPSSSPKKSSSFSRGGGRLMFRTFETQHLDHVIMFIKSIMTTSRLQVITATGGGAFKFGSLLQEQLGLRVQKEDEMNCLITGLNFLVREVPNEVFTYDQDADIPMTFQEISNRDTLFPYILVNIGSGVSIVKVTGDDQYERISGTSCGGGTLWGLLSVLTPCRNFDDMLELSKKGDNKSVDMLVGDIYGTDYDKIGLKSTTIASSCGKIFKYPPDTRSTAFKPEDIAKSNTIGQIAYLNAQIHGIDKIYFGGSYIRGHPATMHTLSYAIKFWSTGKMQALFLRHEGYLGALGAFMKGDTSSARTRHGSFRENFTRPDTAKGSNVVNAIGSLDKLPSRLVPFPLLSKNVEYQPDIVDLTDKEIREYWLDLLDRNLNSFIDIAIQNEHDVVANDVSFRTRIDDFKKLFREHLERFREEPNVYGALSLRSLFTLREQCLHEVGLPDIFETTKRQENQAAIETLPKLLHKIDAMDEHKKLDVLIHGVLAGNMFDWGARHTLELLKDGLDFNTAKTTIQRPDRFNSLPALQNRFSHHPPHEKAMIFVDNSGYDCILGIVPFSRYLLQRGTRVVLAANSYPAVNDITSYELMECLHQISQFDETIRRGLVSGNLTVVGTGSESPCLDLRQISDECAKASDGVVIEGMGRAIHTNLKAEFSCESLKLAVAKNETVAKIVGCDMYDALCIYSSGK